ncbi:MAG TPA: alpha-amylase family glycosyl hydrolase [Armatimonadota bacterium]|jgi:glycosidase
MGSCIAVGARLAACILLAASAHAVPVTLTYKAPDAVRVYVAGTFNSWSSSALAMAKGDNGLWTAKLDLEPGSYQYKFVVDGKWMSDPNAGTPVPPDGNSALWIAPDGSMPEHKRGDGKIVAFAVKHQGMDLLKVNRTHARFTVHTGAEDVDSVSMYLGPKHPAGSTEFDYAVETPLKRIGFDGTTEAWAVTAPVRGQMDYAFILRDGQSRWTFGADGLVADPRPDGGGYRPFEVNMDSLSLFETPAWAKDTVWYQVFPERFFNGDKSNDRKPPVGVPNWEAPLATVSDNPNSHYWGGDLKGIIDKLPYIKALGANGIYLNPIFLGPDSHKYATTDYLKVDPDFGDEATLKALCDKAHKLGMRVMLDGVFNHTSVYNPMFQDILKNQEKSKYAKWYRITSFPVLDPLTHYQGRGERDIPYEGWAGLKWMPRLNPDNPDCAAYILKVATYWIERCRIDGWRLDVANEVPHDFWVKFRSAVKGTKKDSLIVGEIWDNATPWLQGDQFDSVMNYRFRGAVLDFFARGRSDAALFVAALNTLNIQYPPQSTVVMYNLLGSHDVPRLMNECGGDERKAALATVFQMTSPGAPAVYYGDENGMAGGGDPWNRAPMVWDDKKWNSSLRETFKRAIALRRASPALRSSDTDTLVAPEGGRFAAFLRGTPRDAGSLITAFNASDMEQIVSVPVTKLSASAKWKDVWNGGDVSVTNEHLSLKLAPWSAAVLTPMR